MMWRWCTFTCRPSSMPITVCRVMPFRNTSAVGVCTSPSFTKKMLAPVASAT
jgi:hypothetical protein